MPRSDISVLTERTPLVFSDHESLIQTLDRRSNGLYLSKESFIDTVDAWNEVPLIFAQDHPDPDAYDKDPQAELDRIKGRLIKGHASETYIEMTGHPRLMTTFVLEDHQIEKGIAEGKISTSNGFRCKNDGDKLAGTVQPHHILFFEERPNGPVPGDKGVVILNTDTEKDKALLARLKALFTEREAPRQQDGTEEREMADVKELEAKLATKEQELADAKLAFTQLQTKMAEMGEAVKAKDAEIVGLKTENMAFIAKEKDAKWGSFKSKHIPPGMVKGELEKEARKDFEADPLTFMEKVLEFREQHQDADEDGAEGVQFTAGPARQKKVRFEDELRAVGVPCISFSGTDEVK